MSEIAEQVQAPSEQVVASATDTAPEPDPVRIVEALLFAADSPVSAGRIAQVLGRRSDASAVRRMVDELNAFYSQHSRPYEIVEIGGGFQLLTRPEYKKWIAELHRHRRMEKLSPSAIETLALVAYRQPISRATIDDIRGVQSGPLLRSLVDRGLVKVVGYQNVPGRPRLYGTTRLFLEQFGLASLRDLPKIQELAGGRQEEAQTPVETPEEQSQCSGQE